MQIATHPVWTSQDDSIESKPLRGQTEVDVVVVGAGITGLSAAALLREAGRRVLVIEKDAMGAGETGRTTAHVTEAIDVRYHSIRKTFGPEAARLVAAASRRAIEQIATFIERNAIDCGFRRLPGFLYTENRNRVADLKSEAVSAKEAGLDVSFTTEVPLPFPTRGAVRFDNQAQLHPLQYLRGLHHNFAEGVVRARVLKVEGGEPCVVETDGGAIRARAVILATNAPIADAIVHIAVVAQRSYAIAIKSSSEHPDGLFWDTADPYHYTRWQDTSEGTYLIVGGEDHKTGEESDRDRFAALESFASERFGTGTAQYRWSGQIIEPADGLPLIGPHPIKPNVYVATGYSGQGITMGTFAGILLTDRIVGRRNACAELFDPARLPRNGFRKIAEGAIDFAKNIAADRIAQADIAADRTFDVKSGDGKIVLAGGRKVALHRDDGGALHALSPVCTHMKCDVGWNGAEKTWDCPCHGSRFGIDGDVINGPATKPLEQVEVREEELPPRLR